MLSEIIAFLSGGIFVGLISFYLSRMILRAEVIDMINEETNNRIQDQDFNISYLEKKLSIASRQRDIAIEDSKKTLKERNEALIMLSKKF